MNYRESAMTYIVMDPCIKCKFMDCVEVCPVDCFYEGENFLAINPDECIDCGVCEPECPVDAIKPDTEDDSDGKWLRINTEYAKVLESFGDRARAAEEYRAALKTNEGFDPSEPKRLSEEQVHEIEEKVAAH